MGALELASRVFSYYEIKYPLKNSAASNDSRVKLIINSPIFMYLLFIAPRYMKIGKHIMAYRGREDSVPDRVGKRRTQSAKIIKLNRMPFLYARYNKNKQINKVLSSRKAI